MRFKSDQVRLIVAGMASASLIGPVRAQTDTTVYTPPAAANSVPATAVTVPYSAPGYVRSMYFSALRSPLPYLVPRKGLPPTFQASQLFLNGQGLVGLYQTAGAVTTKDNAFFQSLGTNGRSCFTCHQPASGMSISVAAIRERYRTTNGRDPVFAPVDGANCPNAVPAEYTSGALVGGRRGASRRSFIDSHSLILEKGLIRVFLPVPKNAEFDITVVSDPAGCNTDPAYSTSVDPATQEVTQIVSVYRRPRMSANLKYMTVASIALPPPDGFSLPFNPATNEFPPSGVEPATGGFARSGNVMWDGREPTLASQALDATLGHAQATTPPTPAQIQQMVDFEVQAFSAQAWSFWAGDLTAPIGGVSPHGLTGAGGPKFVADESPAFGNFLVAPPTFGLFSLYDGWSGLDPASPVPSVRMRASIARGQALFNTKPISVTNVAGFNGAGGAPVAATCATCHSGQAGSDALPVNQRDVGTGGQSVAFGGPAPSPDLPIFQIACKPGFTTPFNGATVLTNDPGRALITGKCADVATRTIPQLRALAARLPLFSDGSAPNVSNVLDFYNNRFGIGLTAQEKQDMVNFLNAL